MLARRRVETSGRSARWLTISPRVTKSCSARVIPTTSGASPPSAGGALNASTEEIVVILFEGLKTTVSPTAKWPDSMRPATMRRSSPRRLNL